jgi:D-alanyl-D-alanine carboxypeptidase (penicillin-binding protein 5/6)
MVRARRPHALVCLVLIACAVSLHAAGVPKGLQEPDLHSRSAILVDALTGAVLFELAPEEPIAPASLTKLMTVHLALQKIDEGELRLTDWVVPEEDAWASAMPPHSSLMFLGPGQKLTVDQLLMGLVVASGNDAAVEVADLVAGSVPAFAQEMNDEAARLGYTVMHFTEPAGLSADNRITAREYADFARVFIALHPDALRRYFSVRTFTYPLPENLTGSAGTQPVTQSNRNILLGRYPGADGLKTGYLDESGYHMAATAQRGGARLISVILGVPDVDGVSGAELRATLSAELLDYGFTNFTNIRPAWPAAAPVRVWKGAARSVSVMASVDPVVTVRLPDAPRVIARVEQTADIVAPVRKGEVLGHVVVTLDGKEFARFPLEAESSVPRGNVFRRALDSMIIFVRALLGMPVPA